MAVARTQASSGFTAIHVWLITFVGLWLASTVLLVIIYLNQDKKDTAVSEMRTEVEKVVSRTARKLPQFAAARPEEGKTMADLLESARSETARLAVGDADATREAVQQALKGQLERILADPHITDPSVLANASYKDALGQVYDLFRAEADAHAEAGQTVSKLTAELEAARSSQTRLTGDFDTQASQIKGQLEELRADRSQYSSDRDAQIDAFEKQLEQIRQQCSEDIQAQRRDSQQIQRDYDDLLVRFHELTAKLGQAQVSPLELSTARAGDGLVLDVGGATEPVYINLGEKDLVTLGLEFAVYDALTGIPASGQAKARIEVVSLFDQTSECKVVARYSPEPILEGDIIANPIFDRHRPLRFYILGSFDLDGDLRDDADGEQRIAALIERWGGRLESRLSGQVDFVVLGGPPALPRVSADLDPEEDPRYQTALRAGEAYKRELATVQGLALPALTQEVFLSFLGYKSPSAALSGAAAGS